MDTRDILTLVATGIFGCIMGIIMGTALSTARINAIPKENKVQDGFIAPNKLEIICKDLDKSDGKNLPETYIKIGETVYMLRYNPDGKPVIQAYKIKPMEIIPISE